MMWTWEQWSLDVKHKCSTFLLKAKLSPKNAIAYRDAHSEWFEQKWSQPKNRIEKYSKKKVYIICMEDCTKHRKTVGHEIPSEIYVYVPAKTYVNNVWFMHCALESKTKSKHSANLVYFENTLSVLCFRLFERNILTHWFWVKILIAQEFLLIKKGNIKHKKKKKKCKWIDLESNSNYVDAFYRFLDVVWTGWSFVLLIFDINVIENSLSIFFFFFSIVYPSYVDEKRLDNNFGENNFGRIVIWLYSLRILNSLRNILIRTCCVNLNQQPMYVDKSTYHTLFKLLWKIH